MTLTAISYPDGEDHRRPWRAKLDADCQEWFGFGLVTFISKWNAMEITFAVPCIVEYVVEELRDGPFIQGVIKGKKVLEHEQVVEMRMRIPDQWFNL